MALDQKHNRNAFLRAMGALLTTLTAGGCHRSARGGTSLPLLAGGSPPASSLLILTNPFDPVLARLPLSNGHVADMVGLRNANGIPTAVTQVSVRNDETREFDMYLDDAQRPKQLITADGTQFRYTWTSATIVAVTALSADGTVQVSTVADISAVPPSTAPKTVNRQSSPAAGLAPRGGRRISLSVGPHTASTAPIRKLRDIAGAQNVQVIVTKCGLPDTSTSDQVSVVAHDTLTGQLLGFFPAYPTANGHYVATIPTSTALSFNPGAACNALVTILGSACTITDNTPGGMEAICFAVGAALTAAVITVEAGLLILAACERFSPLWELYCAALNDAVTELAHDACSASVLNRTFTGTIMLRATVAALPDNATSLAQTAPGEGPYPTLSVEIGSDPVVRSLSLDPPAPHAQQGYVATADTFCLRAQTILTLSIVGTDGYRDSQTHAVTADQADATYTLNVPGAAVAGVHDTVTVTAQPPTGSTITLTASLVFT
jgi:hypothetical protein